ncbi:hypothetical protein LCGC14_1087320 [marine sediment metagenome]|uniref:HTH luxR-type domain-containing protein n=1 Tax=marine sediment metagenome TaxID=412755 RepID=A0A0F9N134_9ZZZZ
MGSKTLVTGPTYREVEIACELAKGRSQQRIADDLTLSVETVKTHVKTLRRKRNARNSTQLVAFLIRDRYIVFGKFYDTFIPNTTMVKPWKDTRK